MSEYTGEPTDLSVQHIPPATVDNDIGKVARIRRVPGSKEAPNGLAPPARSSPRSLAPVPPHFLDNTLAKLFGKWFLQIIPLLMKQTLLLGTNFTSLFQAPSFYHTLGSLAPKPPPFSQCFVRAEEDDLGVSFTPNPRPPTSLVFRLAWLFRIIHLLYSPNPRPRTSNFGLCVCLRKSS